MGNFSSNFLDFLLHPILQLLILFSWVHGSDPPHKIKHKINETAVLGGNVTIFCNLTSSEEVIQITWQKIQHSLPQNIGTYSNKYGEKILPPYVDRLRCKAIEPSSSFITIQEVTFEDEACYKCLFNVFPRGSRTGQVCLNILTIPELRTELQDAEDVVKFAYSAVGKPAPQISLFPAQVLMNPSEEHRDWDPNGIVTIKKKYNISVETVKSLSLQHLIVHMDHPLKHEEKIVPLPLKQECLPDSHTLQPAGVIAGVFISILFISLIVIFLIWKNKKEKKNQVLENTEEGKANNAERESLKTQQTE